MSKKQIFVYIFDDSPDARQEENRGPFKIIHGFKDEDAARGFICDMKARDAGRELFHYELCVTEHVSMYE